MLVCDGLKHLPSAVAQVWPQTVVQACIVHLLRNSFRYTSKKDWSAIAKAFKPVYTAASEAEAAERFVEFTQAWGQRYPAVAAVGEPLGRVRPVPGLRPRDPHDHFHYQRN